MYHKGMTRPYHAQSGNLFFYIFLAIALFAALTFAVAQGNRGSVEDLANEQDELYAAEIIQYADTMSKAVALMRLRGVRTEQIRFAHANLPGGYGVPNATPEAEIFNIDGGNMVYKAMPAPISGTSMSFVFSGANAIDEVGTTCALATCSDLIMILRDIRSGVCAAINKLLDVTPNNQPIPNHSNVDDTTLYAGTFNVPAETIGDEAGSALLSGKSSGCFLGDADNVYYFYQVLVAR